MTVPQNPYPTPPAKTNTTRTIIITAATITTIITLCCLGIIITNKTNTTPPNTGTKIDEALTTTTTPNTNPTTQETTPPLKTITHTGTGDDVYTLDTPIDVPALFTFQCKHCDGNVIVKAGSELLINEIDGYTGTQLINTKHGDYTDDITIHATNDWTLTIEDLTKAPKDLTEGSGDTVTIHTTTYTKAEITHNGDSNFIIHRYDTNGGNLALNEIGNYKGTLPLTGPCILNIHADGDWTIQPK